MPKSNKLNKTKFVNKVIKLKIDKYFFIWYDNSCRFDSIIFIIYFKLLYLFKKQKI